MLPARANPFRAERIESLHFRLDDSGWQDLLERFAAARWRGLLLGPHGSGKTTLREEIEHRMHASGWQVRTMVVGDRCRTSWQDLADLVHGSDHRTLLSIDGIDRLGPWIWWRFARAAAAAGGILATSHVAGRLPLLHQHQTSVELLHDLVCDLVGTETGQRLQPQCQRLFTELRGDLRACLRCLYDDATDRVLP